MSDVIPIFEKDGVGRISSHVIDEMEEEFKLNSMEKCIIKTTVQCMFMSIGR